MNDMSRYPKIVDNAHYHIWTDALHARALAHQANNRWDRGTYVRWTIITGWTTLEIACEDALQEQGIGRRFKDNLDSAISNRGLNRIDWSCGTWQKIAKIHKTRKDLVHVNPTQTTLFSEAAYADKVIKHLRAAINDIYLRVGASSPPWVEDNNDNGWDYGRESKSRFTVTRAGVDPNSSETIRVGYIYKNEEHICEILPAGTDPEPLISDLLSRIHIPISRVLAYRGDNLIIDRELPMRGA